MAGRRAAAAACLNAGLSVDWILVAELLALGCIGGFLAGLLGIGGGMILVPFTMLILTQRGVAHDLAVKMAIATSMATIFFTSMSSLRAHHKRGAVRWDLARGLAPGILLGGLLAGAGAFRVLKGAWLGAFVGLFVLFSATQMLLERKPAPTRRMPGFGGQLAAGGTIGFLSGLVGAGGAFVSVPFMTWCNVPIHNAVATSAALGFPIALANTIGVVASGWSVPSALPGSFGYLYLPAVALISLASVSTAPLGARTAHAMDMRQLRRAFALMFYLLGGYMLYESLSY